MKPEHLMGRQPQGCWWSLPGHSLLWDAAGRRTSSRNPASKKANPLISPLQVVMVLTKVWDLLISYCILMWTFLHGSQMLCDGGHLRPRKGGCQNQFLGEEHTIKIQMASDKTDPQSCWAVLSPREDVVSETGLISGRIPEDLLCCRHW